MDYRVSGREVNIFVPFFVDGNYVTPDTGTVKYTLYGNDGVVDGTINNITQAVTSPATDTTIRLSTSPATTKGGGTTEQRLLHVDFKVSGRAYSRDFPYTLYDYQNHTISKDDIRRFLVMDQIQLPDADISLPEAYWAVEDDVTAAVLTTALGSGTRDALWANRAILYKASQALLPTIRLRLQAQEQAESTTLIRQKIDWDKLAADIDALYQEATQGFSDVGGAVTPSLILVSFDTDVITGV